ncbi:MAG: multidrug ABC transporter ATP-binding protein [Rhodospirillales bacterium 12-54-5]|nr:MAG: multidrug ABC transporter ATP-binding protein [Rhodospirillales bacterium 12-54-5]
MTTPAIRIQNLTKTYRDRKSGDTKLALKGITMDIPRGSFFGLLGPNGAGKSTLINIMAGTVLKSSGTVEINGHDITTNRKAASLSIGIVPQELVLDTFFTVRQALEITAGYYGIPKDKRHTDAIIDAMGLRDKADSPSRRLSGGMRRRLLIGKALVHTPGVLVLDEPTAGVDVELRRSLWEYVRKLNKAGTTILLTTHYLEEAEELCDEIAIINHGGIIARDRKDTLMQGIDSKEVAFTLETPITELPNNLTGLDASIRAGKLVVKYKPSESHMDTILARLREAGLAIRDISTHEVDLEDLFVRLTSAAA